VTYTEQERLEAAQWFLDIREIEDPSSEMLIEWERWMGASESRRLAFREVEHAWQAVQLAKPIPIASAVQEDLEYDGSMSVHEWQLQQRRQSGQRERERYLPFERPSRQWIAGGSAAAAGLLITLWWASPWQWPFSANHRAQFSTRAGQHMQVTLPDGSQVNLGARSSLYIDYTRNARDVRLLAGEGYFAVQKDRSRPFRVHVLNDVVTAVGTAFDVRATNNRIVVAVSEGTVQVSDAATAPTAVLERQSPPPVSPAHPNKTASVTKGQSLAFSSRAVGFPLDQAVLTSIDPAQASRWREGWLVYQDEPLRDVLTDVSRYTDLDIIIDPDVPVSARFTGAVFKDSVLEWLESLPKAFPVAISHSKARIVITPVKSHSTTPTNIAATIADY
jgi:transmembrane sensor